MEHFIFFVYLLAVVIGLVSIVYLLTRFGDQTDRLKGLVRIHLAYTSMMIAGLALLYLRVNVLHSPQIMALFLSFVLLGQGVLAFTLVRHAFIIKADIPSRGMKIFAVLFPLSFVAAGIIQYFLWPTELRFLPILLGVIGFIIFSLWLLRQNTHAGVEGGIRERRVWSLFLLCSVILAAAELILKIRFGILGEYSLNVPIIFVGWVILNIRQIRRSEGSGVSEVGVVSDAFVSRWELTPREAEIVGAVLRGDSNKEIASHLSISESTVKNHIYNIYQKTGARGRVDLVNLAQ